MLVRTSRRRLLARVTVTLWLALSLAACRAVSRPPAVAPSAPALPAHHLVPLPASIDVLGAPVRLTATTAVVDATGSPDAGRVAELLASALRVSTGLPLPVTSGPRPSGAGGAAVVLRLDPAIVGREAYRIDVAADIELRASTPEGLFRGGQTLRQLVVPAAAPAGPSSPERWPAPSATAAWVIPAVRIADAPRFAWRGAMLDVARHFFDVARVKRYVDLLAYYKLNVLHLHLADDQGWRIAIDSWPRLAAHGGSTSVNADGGGFYTQAQYRDIVAYAAERFITVIPEIDMPGHTNAALASYPELNCNDTAPALYTGIEVGFSSLCVGRDVTYRFVDDVVRELAALTPGPYIHIGGDEVKTLTAQEYAAFVERVLAIVARHGKQAVGWEEIAQARLAPATVVQLWRVVKNDLSHATAAAASAVPQGARLVLSPASRVYLDMKYTPETTLGLKWAGFVELRDAYDWDPVTLLPGVPESSVAGVEAPLWTETIVTMRDIERMVLPRLPAVAEVGWSPQVTRSWESFRDRIARHGMRWDAMGLAYYASPQVEWVGRAPRP